MNTTQQRFEGFLNTPVLWKDSAIYNLTQFKIEQELLVRIKKRRADTVC